MTLTFNLRRAIVITHTHKKTQVQSSVGSKYRRKQTDGQTDGQADAVDCFTVPANAVGNNFEVILV